MKIGFPFNWNYFIYAFVGLLEVAISMKLLVTQKGRGIISQNLEGKQALIAGSMYLLLGAILISVPFVFHGKKSQQRKLVEFFFIFIGILMIEKLALVFSPFG